MAEERRVYVVDGADRAVEGLASAVPEATVETVSASQVVVQLCRTAVDCLVVPSSITAAAENVVYAARGLFPDLPIVVFGPEPPATAGTTVVATSLDDDAVIAAVREVIESTPRPESARPPSRPETLLASMFEGIPAHLYAKDTNARHLIASDELLDPADLLGLTDMETLSGDETYDEANFSDDLQVIEDGESVLRRDEYTDSAETFLRTSKVPWRDSSGDILGLVGITQDVTELREQKEKLRRRNRRLRKVALMTAHELRNELQVATGYLSQIENEGERVEAASESVDRVSGIVDKIVSMATFNERASEPQTLWLSALVRDVWEAIAAPEASLSITGDRQLFADRDATQLLVELLLDNAIVHGGPEVSIEVGGTEDGFYVADDGPGIGFDPPQRAFEPAVTSVDSESGFGLYIAQQIADEQGWHLHVTDSDEGGARFDVTGTEPP